jgi:hypothetical protein
MEGDPKILDLLAAAGTEAIVFRSPDFQDISHGVSWGGSYDAAPPNIREVVDKTHKLGMKALWWVSVRGVLKRGRNEGRPDPMLVRHPEWFLPGCYWGNKYQHATYHCNEWNEWLLTKLRSDLKTYNLDGFGFDEPYYLGIAVNAAGETHARSAYRFFEKLRKTIKGIGRETLMIANYPCTLHDEWKFFDYYVMESGTGGWMNRVTLGMSQGGWGHGGHFTFERSVTQLAYGFGEFNQTYGWTHPVWVLNLHKDPGAKKSAEDLARLASLSGRGNRLWSGEIAPGLRQVESRMTYGTHAVILCNVGDKPVAARVGLHAIPTDRTYRVNATLDTKTRAESGSLSWNPRTHPSLDVGKIPPMSVLALYLRE